MKTSKIKDKFGTVFNPAVHQAIKGTPRFKKDGSFVPLKGKAALVPKSELPPPRKKRAKIAPKGTESAQPSDEKAQETQEIGDENSPKIAPNVETPPANLGGDSLLPPNEKSPGVIVFETPANVLGLEMPKITSEPAPVTDPNAPENSGETPAAPSGENSPAEERKGLTGTIGADDIPDSGAVVEQVQGMLASDACAEMLEMVNVTMFGDGMTMKPVEKEKIHNAFKRLFGGKNFEVPPWLDLTLCLGTYYVVRVKYMKQVAATRLAEQQAAEAKARAASEQRRVAEAERNRVKVGGAGGTVAFDPAGATLIGKGA